MRLSMRSRRFVGLFALTWWCGAGAFRGVHAQTVLDSCGQSVSGDVELASDLDCSAAAEPWVTFESSGTLALSGYTFSGTVIAPVQALKIVGPGTITGPGHGVFAEGSFTHGPHISIGGGAEIAGNEGFGIFVDANPGNRPSVKIHASSISGNGESGIYVATTSACPFLNCIPPGKVRIRDSAVVGNLGGAGVSASNVVVQGSTISGNYSGVQMQFEYIGRKLSVKDSSIDDNVAEGVRMATGAKAKLKVIRSSVSRNATAIHDDTRGERSTIKLRDAVLDGNGYGYNVSWPFGEAVATFSAVRSSISESVFAGISVDSPIAITKLNATTVTGSGSDPDCGSSVACFDLDTAAPSRVAGSASCGTSHVFGSGLPGADWGLCSLD